MIFIKFKHGIYKYIWFYNTSCSIESGQHIPINNLFKQGKKDKHTIFSSNVIYFNTGVPNYLKDSIEIYFQALLCFNHISIADNWSEDDWTFIGRWH